MERIMVHAQIVKEMRTNVPCQLWEGLKGVWSALASAFRNSGQASEGECVPTTCWTHEQLLTAEFPEQRWIVKDLVPDEGLTVLAGKKKLGKSWLVLQMAQAVASGRNFLGKVTSQGSVVYLALEDGPTRLSVRVKKQGALDVQPITYITRLDALDRSGMAELKAQIEKHAPRLLILDTLAAAKSGKVEENDAGDMADLFNPLRRLAQECHLGILVVAHHGKRVRGDAGDDIRGSSALAAAADMIISLYRSDSGTWLSVEGRDVVGSEIRISFNASGNCTWSLSTDTRQMSQSIVDTETIEAVAALGECDAEAVADYLGKARATVQDTLKRLRETGRLVWRKVSDTGRVLYSVKEED